MVRQRSYLRWAAALTTCAWLLAGCASNDPSSQSDQSSASEESEPGSGNHADFDGDNAADGDDDSESEAPLDPSRSYPSSGMGTIGGSVPSAKRDAGSASSARAATPGVPGVSSPTGDAADRAATPPRPNAPPPVAPQPVNPFVDATKDRFSTFGADVDSASYDYLRQSLASRALPRPEYVRVEEYVNYFKYAYAKPEVDAVQPFAISLAASSHPMGRSTTLLRVGIQAKPAPVVKKQANLVFLVDVSGSMASPEKLPLVKRVLEQSLNVLAPEDKVSIVSYASDTRVRLAPTPVASREAIAAVVQGLEASGSTDGGSGIQLAYEQALAGFLPDGINHVILCTDGDFNVGITSSDALLALIREKRATGVTLTALGFGRDNLNDAMMEKVSNAGNGSYSIIYSEDQAIAYANQRLLATIVHVAKDMKIQVEFNPAQVLAYRLVGYEDRAIADGSFRDDKVDGGEVGADHRVTALYELVLVNGQLPQLPGIPPLSPGESSTLAPEIDVSELVRVKVRSKPVTATDADPATEVSAALKPSDIKPSADADAAWASAVATVAEILRKSPYASAGELANVQRIVDEQKAADADRTEFAALLTMIRSLLTSTP